VSSRLSVTVDDVGPMIASTSARASSSTPDVAVAMSAPSSATCNCTGRPFTPPVSLICATASSTVACNDRPSVAPSPVNGARTPIRRTPSSGAAVDGGTATVLTTVVSGVAPVPSPLEQALRISAVVQAAATTITLPIRIGRSVRAPHGCRGSSMRRRRACVGRVGRVGRDRSGLMP